jgi:hypothetical protein
MASLDPSFGKHATESIAVLCGMRGLLARHHPRVIFECLPETPAEPIERLLRELGYKIFLLTGQGPAEVDQIIGDAKQRHHNFLATTSGLTP